MPCPIRIIVNLLAQKLLIKWYLDDVIVVKKCGKASVDDFWWHRAVRPDVGQQEACAEVGILLLDLCGNARDHWLIFSGHLQLMIKYSISVFKVFLVFFRFLYYIWPVFLSLSVSWLLAIILSNCVQEIFSFIIYN